jgi:phage terminase small subunit
MANEKHHENGCTGRQNVFACRYAETGNAKQSAIEAGYSPKSAHDIGSRLLKNVQVKREIERQQKYLGEASTWTAQKVLYELGVLYSQAKAENAHGPAKDILKMLGQHNGLFKEQKTVEHQHTLQFERMLEDSRKTKVISPTIPAIAMDQQLNV